MPDSFDVRSPSEAVRDLVQAARRACFVEACLAPGLITGHRVHHRGTVVEPRTVG